ncbi:hypothetical protein RND81_13G002600 [Saponaria officinalis]|uniref:glucomannan 4-beta-mannosyltransferase n=1 Tax=Saponaria officinalis TaxID=3572 RepID=A0AAW1GVV4_SAPOF
MESLLYNVYGFDYGQIGPIWELTRSNIVVPLFQSIVYVCLAMSLMVFVECVFLNVVISVTKIIGKTPEKTYKSEALIANADDNDENYPMLLVQIPMFNERQSMVEMECQRWAENGINIHYEGRGNRKGYKAGALKDAMKCSYVQDCDYVAIFDADFRPDPDFLRRTIPYLVHNPEIGLVQARWVFVNADECLLTRMQKMSLDYHFTLEQEVGSSTYAFFGFDGTAGVWRTSTIKDAGGWEDTTTVEDMDLTVRAFLKGWKFVYLGDLKVESELPSTLKAYRYQQHRWSCGHANLFKKMVKKIAMNQKVSLWRKIYVIYNVFLVRKVVAHTVAFVFYCVIMPTTVLIPEVVVPKWASTYIPITMTLLLFLYVDRSPRTLPLLMFSILFETVMSLHKSKAIFIGLWDIGRVNEWIVTEKLGDTLKNNIKAASTVKSRLSKFRERLNMLELIVCAYLLFCGCYDFNHGHNRYYISLFIQSFAFFLVGISYVGTFVPGSSNSNGDV